MLKKPVLLQYYKTYIDPVIGYGLFLYGCSSIQKPDWNLFYFTEKGTKTSLFKAGYYPSAELFSQIYVLAVYEFHTIKLHNCFLLQFGVFYQLNILILYLSAKYLMFKAENHKWTYFVCQMNPALLVVIICDSEVEIWSIAW